jgi:DNA invertase Pin-like site-specific DNA recombinase
MNAIGYIRVSPYLESVIAQETAITNFCEQKGLNLLIVFKDTGEYNEDMERESWLALEEYVRYNRSGVDFLLFLLPAKITRFNKMIDQIQDHFKREYGVMLVAVL